MPGPIGGGMSWSANGGFHAETRTVLVVEDNWMVLEMLRDVLRSSGLEVLVAPEPLAGTGLLRARSVDVLITDFFAGTSPESCRLSLGGLLIAARQAGIPILGVTGRVFDPTISAAEFGVDDIIAKPFDVDEVVRRVWALAARGRRVG